MGKKSGLSDRLSAEQEKEFEGLTSSGYVVSSPKDANYNCIAFAAGDVTKVWDPAPIPIPGYYWPATARKDNHPDALLTVFESLGYEVCTDGNAEVGYEKVVLYVDQQGAWSHAARQEPNGEWLSKLGREEDVRHKTPHCFGGSIYGQVAYYMKRKLKTSEDVKDAKEETQSERKAIGEAKPAEPPPTHPA